MVEIHTKMKHDKPEYVFCRIVGNDGLYIAEGGLKAGNGLGVKAGLLLDF